MTFDEFRKRSTELKTALTENGNDESPNDATLRAGYRFDIEPKRTDTDPKEREPTIRDLVFVRSYLMSKRFTVVILDDQGLYIRPPLTKTTHDGETMTYDDARRRYDIPDTPNRSMAYDVRIPAIFAKRGGNDGR
jgi:hypothetical protein